MERNGTNGKGVWLGRVIRKGRFRQEKSGMMIRIKKWKRQSLVARTYSSGTDENVNLPSLLSLHSLFFPLSSVLAVRGWCVYLKLCPAAAWMYTSLSACCVCFHENGCSHPVHSIGLDHLLRHTAVQCLIKFERRVCMHVYCSSIRIAVEVQSEWLCQLTAHLEAL